jgi:CelD/BcsL family acetyltransferase involved in cellulose biosynthesis
MGIRLIQAHELDAGLIEKWRKIQANNSNLRSPYYCPEYAKTVHETLQGSAPQTNGHSSFVEIAVLESGSSQEVKGFFPFQRGPWGQIFPVGRYMTDYQGLVSADDFSEYDPAQLLSAIKARYFAFNHLPLTAAVFSQDAKIMHQSPVMQTEGGYEAYVERLKVAQNTSKPGIFAEVRKRTNRIVRELGPLRFEKHEQRTDLLEKLIQLKIAQWKIGAPAGTTTAFEIPWVNHLIHSLFEKSSDAYSTKPDGAQESDAFRCALSTLYAGDTLLAIQLSLRFAQTLHCWFPVYDPKLAVYSAGTVLMKPLTEHFAADGVGLIDLGRGAATYKMRICTGSVALGEGACSNPAILAKGLVGGRLAVRTLRRRVQQLRKSTDKQE